MERSKFNPKIGDTVKIRQWSDMVEEFGVDEDGNIPCEFSFCEFMKGICGDEFEITSIKDDSVYGHQHGNVRISIDMIEPAPEDEIDGTEIDEFLSGIIINKKEQT